MKRCQGCRIRVETWRFRCHVCGRFFPRAVLFYVALFTAAVLLAAYAPDLTYLFTKLPPNNN